MRNVRQADMGEYPPVFLLSLLMGPGWSQALAEKHQRSGGGGEGGGDCYTQVVFQALGFISFFQAPPLTCYFGTTGPCRPPGSENRVHLTLSSLLPLL